LEKQHLPVFFAALLFLIISRGFFRPGGAVYVKKYNIEMDNLQGICYNGLRMNV